jgi:hypothetical protein
VWKLPLFCKKKNKSLGIFVVISHKSGDNFTGKNNCILVEDEGTPK